MGGCDSVDKFNRKLELKSDKYFSFRTKINTFLDLQLNAVRFEGDSMAAGQNYDPQSASVHKVYDWSDFKDAETHGISGAPLEIIFEGIVPRKAAVIVLFAGFNDIKHVQKPEADIVSEYAKVLNRVKLLSDKVVCVGVPPMVHSKSDVWYPEGAGITNARITSVDSYIHNLCGDSYIDTPSFWADSDSDDGIHPNRQGYSKIVFALKSKIPAKYQTCIKGNSKLNKPQLV